MAAHRARIEFHRSSRALCVCVCVCGWRTRTCMRVSVCVCGPLSATSFFTSLTLQFTDRTRKREEYANAERIVVCVELKNRSFKHGGFNENKLANLNRRIRFSRSEKAHALAGTHAHRHIELHSKWFNQSITGFNREEIGDSKSKCERNDIWQWHSTRLSPGARAMR